jgi:hypothetical protein
MNLERLLRSPLVNAVLCLLLGTDLLLLHHRDRMPERLPYWIAVLVLAYVAIWFTLVFIHNNRHPDRRIRMSFSIPSEFREEDEGQQWMNYRATRRVYMLYCAAIPTALVWIALAPDGTVAGIVSLTLLGATQQVMYWWELRKWEKN